MASRLEKFRPYLLSLMEFFAEVFLKPAQAVLIAAAGGVIGGMFVLAAGVLLQRKDQVDEIRQINQYNYLVACRALRDTIIHDGMPTVTYDTAVYKGALDFIGKLPVDGQLRFQTILAEMDTSNAFVGAGIAQPAAQQEARFKVVRAAERLAVLLPAFDGRLKGRSCPLFSSVLGADAMPLEFLK